MNMLFPGQQENEQIIEIVRKHWFYLFQEMIVWLIFVAVLFAIDKFLPIYLPSLFQNPLAPYLALFKNLYTLFLILGLLMLWEMYYLNMQIVTDQRIVDISQDGIFSHTVSELSLSKIEDVTGETKGIFGTMLGFGNVYVQTAGTVDRFTFDTIPHPEILEKKILDASQSLSKQKI